jgi:hypothetical protein
MYHFDGTAKMAKVHGGIRRRKSKAKGRAQQK